jgi:CheY-like chemotaxis protein
MAKILLVEDDAVQIELIRKLLEPRGHVVVIARNGLDGIKSAQQEKPGLILMDMIMPGMHGLEATIKLKEDTATSDIPIIALTIMSSPKFVRECYQAGVIGYIKKPYDPKVLLESVERVVGKPEKNMGKILMIARASRLATMIEMRLVRQGYEVETLDVKKSVLAQLGSGTAGAIFVDVSLPEARVTAVFDELRGAESTQGVPVIIFAPQMSHEALGEAASRWGTPFQIAAGGELGDVLRRIKESAGD